MDDAARTKQLESNQTRVLTLSTLAFTLLFAVWLMLGVLGVAIQKELGLSAVQFSWLAASAIFTGSMLRLPYGMLTDRWGGKTMTLVCLVGAALPCYLMSRVESYEGALACALAYGFAGNSFSVGVAWNAAWFPRERQGVALGTFGAGNVGASVTKLIGPGLMSLVPAAGMFGGLVPGGWRAVPVLYSVLLCIMAVVVIIAAPAEDRRPSKNRGLSSMLAPLKELRVWRFGLYYVLVFGAYVALSLWLPRLYVTAFGLELKSAALLTAFFIFPASLLRPIGGWMSDKWGGRKVTYGVFLLMLAASLVLSVPPARLGVIGVFTGTFVLGIGMGLGKASVYKYIPEYYPSDVGAVGGLVGTVGALGGFFLPLTFGYLESAGAGIEVCFYVLAALSTVCLCWLHIVVTGLRAAERAKPSEAAFTPAE
jgi:MFS transporter, NNP family, nitrate/nitrite transporter